MNCIFTVDVEDWFHILDVPSSPPLSQWASMPSRVEKNFFSLLGIFSEYKVHVTCFFLGWVAGGVAFTQRSYTAQIQLSCCWLIVRLVT